MGPWCRFSGNFATNCCWSSGTVVLIVPILMIYIEVSDHLGGGMGIKGEASQVTAISARVGKSGNITVKYGPIFPQLLQDFTPLPDE